MRNRLIAWILVFALVVSLMPQVTIGVSAEGEPVSSVPAEHKADVHLCEECEKTATWEAWGDTAAEKTSLPTATGHYYLVDNVTVKASATNKYSAEVASGANVVLCLNGKTIDGSNQGCIYNVKGKLTIADCTAHTDADTYKAGTIQNGYFAGGVAGAFYVNNNASLAVYDAILRNNENSQSSTTTVAYSGGAVHVRGSGASLKLDGVHFYENSTNRQGGAICVRQATKVSIENCVFNGNSADAGGAVYVLDGNAAITNCQFDGNTATDMGGAVYTDSAATISGCSFNENTATNNGGAVYSDGAVAEIANTVFTQNEAKLGGAVCAALGTVVMTGCELKENKATATGAAALYVGSCDLIAENCDFIDNISTAAGASAVYITATNKAKGSNVTLKNCTVTGNHSVSNTSDYKGAVYVATATDKLTLSGKVEMEDNVMLTKSGRVDIGVLLQAAGEPVDIGGLTDGSKLNIKTYWGTETTPTMVTAATAPAAWKRTWVIYVNNGMAVDYNTTKGFHFAVNTDHIHCSCGVENCTDTSHTKVEFLPWTNTEALPSSSNYYLKSDVQVREEVELSGDLTLCLNGKKITTTAQNRFYSTNKNNPVVFTICDCEAKTDAQGNYTAGSFTGGADVGSKAGGGAINLRAGSELRIYDGIFADNLSDQGGGAIAVAAGAKLSIYDGLFIGNRAASADGASLKHGGAIYLNKNAELAIFDGTIRENKGANGGAIYAAGNATLQVQGGNVQSNEATNGGAIFLAADAKLQLSDSVIKNNRATANGGGIYVSDSAELTVNGDAVVVENTVAENANNVYLLGDNLIKLGTLGNDAKIGVGAEEIFRAITPNCDTDYSEQFASDSSVLVVKYRDGAMYLGAAKDHIHCECGDLSCTKDGAEHEKIEFKPYYSGTSLPESGNYYLTTDVTLNGAVEVDGKLTLCLCGNDITVATGRAFTLRETDELTITDCQSEAGKINGAKTSAVLFSHSNETKAIFNLYNGVFTGNTASNGGGAVMVQGYGVFNMYGGTLTGNTVKAEATVDANGNPVLDDKNVQKVTGTYGGGAICTYGGNAVINIYGGTISDNHVTSCQRLAADGTLETVGGTGGAIYTDSQLNLFGGTITGNTADRTGGGVYAKGAKVTLKGTEISKNEAESGGGLILTSKGHLDFVDGKVSENKANSGAGLYLSTGTTTNMTGGSVIGNEATGSGGGINQYKSTGTYTGGVIEGNISGKNGGGVVCDRSELTLSGVQITKNTAAGTGAGVQVTDGSAVTLGGDTVIAENVSGSAASNLYLVAQTKVKLIQLGANAKIGVGVAEPFRFISEKVETDLAANFTSDLPSLKVIYKDSALYLDASGEHTHCLCNSGKASGCDHAYVAFAAWNDASSLPVSGNYYLTCDVTLDKAVEVDSKLNLCLNGKNITVTTGRAFTLRETDELNITDCQSAAGKISGAKTSAVLFAHSDDTKAIFNLYNGVFTGNTATNGGGAVMVQGYGVFNMYGGALTGNTVKAQATVDANGKPVLDDKNVQKATGTYGGGAICTYGGDAVINIYGGTISDNHVTSCQRQKADGTLEEVGGTGGAIYTDSQLNLYCGTITGNTADRTGGGVYVKGAKVTLKGAEISKNEAASGGGLILTSRGHLDFADGKISANKATTGGGLYISTNTTFNMTGGSITGNEATGSGGGINHYKSSGTYAGGAISENSAANGGGIFCNGSSLELAGVKILSNTASKHGGGIKTAIVKVTGGDNIVSEITMSAGAISENKASLGAGMLVEGSGCKMTMTGGEITRNQAAEQAGGIYTSTKTTFVMTDGLIANNSATKYAGAVVYKGNGTFTGGQITGNTATKDGGGLYVSGENSVALLDGTKIWKNTANNAGGVLVANGAAIELKSGEVTQNNAQSGGAGVFISANSTLKMTGGKVFRNTATKNGGGVYALQGNLTLSGGSISDNKATTGGGLHISGSTVTFSGTSVTGNAAVEGNGGGVNVTRRAVTKNGVTTNYPSKIILKGSVISNNTANLGAGMLMAGTDGQMEMHSGAITGNTAVKQAGGLYVSTKCKFEMTGGSIYNNKAGGSGAGIYHNKSVGIYTGGQIYNNVTETAAGAMYASSSSSLSMRNVSIYGNTAATLAGAIYLGNDVPCEITDCKFYENTATTRGGVFYGAPGADLKITTSTFTDNKAGELGGAVCVRDTATLTQCEFVGNTAEKGGAVFAGNVDKTYAVNGWGTKGPDELGLKVYNTKFVNNEAKAQGGALYLTMSAYTDMQDTEITGNTSGAEGSAIWAEENLTMINVTATGNTSANNGHAVYLADSEYDGQTYIKGLMKMGGNMIIKDNQGGDMYLGNMVTVGALPQGYGEKTYVGITLDTGLLTQRVFGAYNYEGGNCVYTITYGDRSITDPEYVAPALEDVIESAGENTLLYVTVGVFAVAIAAVAVILMKKKKNNKQTAEAEQK